MSQGKEFLDSLNEAMDETNRERVSGLLQYIRDEISLIEYALRDNDTLAVSRHFREIREWANTGLDVVETADDVWDAG